ncbi:tRNA preQ1(34) S-adenosylmethionine ribosyltransferase-isomerase QueA [Patescibacteria group bacterium]|nr:tRNA preQ1(34) S-adenosylmethionine ribosyltransferase-isomerase QueA [Patescibacteria group bacterium]
MIFNNYTLPEELIANTPVTPRDKSKLLVVNRNNGDLKHRQFFNLVDYISSNDVLVFNDTRVIKARLIGRCVDTQADNCELFLLHREENGYFQALCKPGRKFKVGRTFVFKKGGSELVAEVIRKNEDGSILVDFKGISDEVFFDLLDQVGTTPLPPYIKNSKATDDQYQTVYAKNPGSVAAPTAGLHFTDELLDKLKEKGAALEYVTLRVGRGTFEPIKVDDYKDHDMHCELAEISDETAERLNKYKAEGRRIIAVGTTGVRTLESFAGVNGLAGGRKETNLFIYPPYEYKFVDALITNFHLPKSTLLLLVGALSGSALLKKAYAEAIEKEYRFYSFGDAMFIY